MLNTSLGARDREVVARFDLRGSPCVVDLKGGRGACKQKRSAGPVLVDLLRSRTVYPDGGRYDTLSLMRSGGSKQALWNLDEHKSGPDGRGFQIVKLSLVAGQDGWLDIETVEHALPGRDDESFRPGPPLVSRYAYVQGSYVRKGS